MSKTKAFFQKYKSAAIEAATGTKIFPEIILAAAALESRNGESLLTTKFNNFFGIKAGPTWSGGRVTMPTKEVLNGKTVTIDQPFRIYKTPADSFKDYVNFISGPRYKAAGVLKAKTPAEQAKAIAAAGYATDPKYSDKLNQFIKIGGTVAMSLGVFFIVGLTLSILLK
jgi:flagellum-specific peptidoglycan hydrolase FlgJ